MKYLLVLSKTVVILSLLFIGKNALAVPTVEAQVVNYTLAPTSGASFNRIEQLSIVILANKLSKEFRSPYTLTYRIKDKAGNIIEDKKEGILFTMCDDQMTPVKVIGKCGDFNNITTIKLKSRQTRKPPSTEGYIKEGRFWIKEDEVAKYPRFEEMNYKLDSFTLTDKSGKVVNI